jgi:hypothetical protein
MKEEEEKEGGEGSGGRKVNKEALEAGEEVGTVRVNRIVGVLIAVMVFNRFIDWIYSQSCWYY